MGKLKGIGRNQTKLRITATQRSGNPKKIAKAITDSMFGNPMHSKSFGLEGEEKFGSCKRKLDTMMDPLKTDILEQMNSSLPWQTNPIRV